MTDATKYIGMRITSERNRLLHAIATQTGATWEDTTFVNLKRAEAEPYIAAICKALGMDPTDKGSVTSAVDFALKSAAVAGGIEPMEGETALMLALRWMAAWVGEQGG